MCDFRFGTFRHQPVDIPGYGRVGVIDAASGNADDFRFRTIPFELVDEFHTLFLGHKDIRNHHIGRVGPEPVDPLLSVGGGSVLDATKFIAAAEVGEHEGAPSMNQLLVLALLFMATLPFVAVRGGEPVEPNNLGYQVERALGAVSAGGFAGTGPGDYEVLDANGHKPEDVDIFVFHQANLRINEAVTERLGVPLLFGIYFWVMLQAYYEVRQSGEFTGSVFAFYPGYVMVKQV